MKLEHFDDGSDGDDTEYNVSEIELSLNARPSGVLVRLSWGRSPSPDVTGYVIKVVDNKAAQIEKELSSKEKPTKKKKSKK